MFKIRAVKRGDTLTIFNPKTGETIIDGDGNCDSPFLLDVSLTSKCNKECPYCYKKANRDGHDMSYEDFKILLKRMVGSNVFQVAYGGGNPNEHPDFINILKETRNAGIIPNYSTNGEGLTPEIINATKKYCGAVAVTFHDAIDSYEEIVKKLIKASIKTNVHFIMKKDEVGKICDFLKNPPEWALGINAVVLLRFKKCNIYDFVLEPSSDDYEMIFESAKSSDFKVGFDACSFFLIKKYLPEVDSSYYDYCQGSRSSAYVNEDLVMSPCSFDKVLDTNNDLHNQSIATVFKESASFRKRNKEINEKKICHQYFEKSF